MTAGTDHHAEPSSASRDVAAGDAEVWFGIGGVDAAIVAVLAAAVAFCALRPIYNIDVWWHICAGRWMLEHGRLPTENVWSAVDPSTPWRSIQPLYQVIAAYIDQHWGLEALRLSNVAWLTGSFLLFYGLVRRSGMRPTTALLLTALLLTAFHLRIRVRPHVVNLPAWTLLGASAVWARRLRPWHALLFGLGFFAWSGFHTPASLYGVFGLAAVAAVHMWCLRDAPDRRVPFLLAMLAAAAGWIAWPGAAGALVQLVEQSAYVTGSSEMGNWVSSLDDTGWHPAMVAIHACLPIAVVAWIAVARGLWRRRDELESPHVPYELTLALVLIGLSFLYFRMTFLAVLALWLCLVAARRADGSMLASALGSARRMAAGGVVVSACLLVAALHFASVDQFGTLSASFASRRATVDVRVFPVAVTELLAESGVEARVAAPAGWGGYILYQGEGSLTVIIDGRLQGSAEVREANRQVAQIFATGVGVASLPSIYSTLPADFLLMPHPAFGGAADTGEWVEIATTPEADLYVRRGPQLADWMPALVTAAQRMGVAE